MGIQQRHGTARRFQMKAQLLLQLLQAFLTYQDNLESSQLVISAEEKALTKLQTQIELRLSELATITNHIQVIASENELLRQEISRLRHQLVATSTL